MSEALPVWNCGFAKSPAPEAADLRALTVGAKFVMTCKGDIAVPWKDGEAVHLQFPKKEDAYTLHVLKTEKLAANEAIFEVTAYKPGPHKPDYVRVTQGATGFEVAKPEWEVQSVLKKNEPPPQPFPSFGPWTLGFPMWLLIALAVVLAIIGLAIFRVVRRYGQRNRMMTELARHKTALSPIHQFYRDARQLRRRLGVANEPGELKAVADDLDRDFRLFILREFLIPTLDWSDAAIAADLRKRHRKVYDQAGEGLKKALRELARMKTRPEVKAADVEQLHRMSMDAVERIERAKDTRGRR